MTAYQPIIGSKIVRHWPSYGSVDEPDNSVEMTVVGIEEGGLRVAFPDGEIARTLWGSGTFKRVELSPDFD